MGKNKNRHKNKRKRGKYQTHFPKRVTSEQVHNIARYYLGGTYYCVGDGKKTTDEL